MWLVIVGIIGIGKSKPFVKCFAYLDTVTSWVLVANKMGSSVHIKWILYIRRAYSSEVASVAQFFHPVRLNLSKLRVFIEMR